MIYLLPFSGKSGHEDGSYHSEFCPHGTHMWDFKSDLYPQWTATLNRMGDGQYKLKYDGVLSGYEMFSFFGKIATITNGGRR
jgi:hypothetical protein